MEFCQSLKVETEQSAVQHRWVQHDSKAESTRASLLAYKNQNQIHLGESGSRIKRIAQHKDLQHNGTCEVQNLTLREPECLVATM